MKWGPPTGNGLPLGTSSLSERPRAYRLGDDMVMVMMMVVMVMLMLKRLLMMMMMMMMMVLRAWASV